MILRRFDRALEHRLPVGFFFWYPFLIYLGWLEYQSLDGIGGIAAEYRTWIWVAALLNTVMLTLGLALLDGLIECCRPAWVKWLWGGCLGVITASFFFDFCLYKMMAIHLPTGIRLVLGNGWRQFLLTVDASGVRPAHLRVFCYWAVATFVCGMLVTRATWWFSRRVTIMIRMNQAAAGALGLTVVLTVWELGTEKDNAWAKSWEEVHRVMPFAIDLVHHISGRLLEVGSLPSLQLPPSLDGALEDIGSPRKAGLFENARSGRLDSTLVLAPRQSVARAFGALPFESRQPRPDVFVFVLESTRRDYVTAGIAPNLARLSEECLKFRDSVSSGNATQLSWFSLLTAKQPLYFEMVERRPELWGSVPLRILRRAGYKIYVLSSTYMNYHDIDRIAFGPDLGLANSVFDARDLSQTERPDRDREITRLLVKEIPKQNGGRIFFVFYDSTHHDYYWPSDFPAPFQPFAKEWKYFDFNISPSELLRIKNRYRNALHFVDSLFGVVVDELKTNGRYDDALIFAVGDHGEEFLEHGKLVHASELWREQTHVPFFVKLPRGLHPAGCEKTPRFIGSHVDFLPTLLDCLGIAFPTNVFDGQSLFRKSSDFAITAADNGGRDPYRFCLSSGDRKAWFQYRSGSTFTALERSVYLTKLTDSHDNEINVEVGSPAGLQLLEITFADGLSHLYPRFPLHFHNRTGSNGVP